MTTANMKRSKKKFMHRPGPREGWHVSGYSEYKDPTTRLVKCQLSYIDINAVASDLEEFKNRYPDAQSRLDVQVGIRNGEEKMKYMYVDLRDVLERTSHLLISPMGPFDADAFELILNASVSAFFNHHSNRLCENHVVFGSFDECGKYHQETFLKIKLGDRKLRESTRRGGFLELPKSRESHTISWTYL